jgi:hypothetical protein
MTMAPRLTDAIYELVHDQPILVFERRRHALAFHARDLEAEGDDEHRVDGRRYQRLEPRHELVPDLREPDAGARHAKVGCRGDRLARGRRRGRFGWGKRGGRRG